MAHPSQLAVIDLRVVRQRDGNLVQEAGERGQGVAIRLCGRLVRDDPAALRAALIGYTEKVIALEAAKVELQHQVEEISPKAAIYDRFLNADGLIGLQDLGGVLGQKPNKFIERLKPRYLFDQGGVPTPRQEFVDRGIFRVTSVLVDGFAGVGEAFEHIMGYPVWTHEMPTIRDRAKQLVLEQFPDMPTDAGTDFRVCMASVRQRFGETVPVKRGSDARAADPVTTLDMARKRAAGTLS